MRRLAVVKPSDSNLKGTTKLSWDVCKVSSEGWEVNDSSVASSTTSAFETTV